MIFSETINQLHHAEIVPQEEIKKLLPQNITIQWKQAGILTEDDTLQSIPCLECSACFSKIEKIQDGARGYCETYNDFYILPETYNFPSLKFSDEAFFSSFKEKFSIMGTMEKLGNDLFYLGFTTTPRLNIFFSYSESIEKHRGDFQRLAGSNEKCIFIVPFGVSKFTPLAEYIERTRAIVLDNLLSITGRSLKLNTEEFEYLTQSSFREVEFTLQGQLTHSGSILREYDHGTKEYVFLKTLWDMFGRAVSYEDICKAVKKDIPTLNYKSATSFCEITKSRICNKDKHTKATVEKIIIKASAIGSKKGYRMTNPQ